jgi:hypothetical protein
VELSYELSFRNPKAYTFERDLSSRLDLSHVRSPQELDFIKTMARDSFKYRRMLEDLNVDLADAQQRTVNWIDMLANSSYKLFLLNTEINWSGFMYSAPHLIVMSLIGS